MGVVVAVVVMCPSSPNVAALRERHFAADADAVAVAAGGTITVASHEIETVHL